MKKTLESMKVGSAFSDKTTQKCLFWLYKAACAPVLQADLLGVELLASKLFSHGLTHRSLMQYFIAVTHSGLILNESPLHEKALYFGLSIAAF